ncbi:Ger(x)C family spore germination protein [Clostridium sp. cel8]|jgi:Ger(x)C family germination protein|uniref:Ger(x)C family spore germination protein n=1 Tax=unclassified Clostridium TaxID=2614128 RepID=UPI0015F5E0EF|nr:Ger(x)C family spore germination protein [Clostridium sp. cel8]MBA5850221.1 Ger(x)C family spore germination protein [Clostridium sp. cel8]
MKRKLSILIKIIVCIFISLNMTSCWSSKELNKLAIVRSVGIDKAIYPNPIKLTVQIAKVLDLKSSAKSTNQQNTTTAGYFNLEEDGTTISGILQKFSRKLNRELFFSHNQLIIFGKDVAESGIQKHIDFFMRNRESRLLVWILISKQPASEILSIQPELGLIPGDNISELVTNQKKASQIAAINLKEFSSRLMSETTSAIAPIIEEKIDNNKKVSYLSETAVFKKDKMIGTLDKNETTGLLWAIDKMHSGIISINLKGCDDTADIKVLRCKSKIIPYIRDNQPAIKININQEGDLQEQTCYKDLANPNSFSMLQEEESKIIKDQILSALNKAKDLDADVFGFGDAIHKHYPNRWKSIKKNWDEVFKHIHVEINVDSKLRRSGKITKPIASE